MNLPSLTQLIPILQLSVSPVILISGVGLLLLTLTNRFGRMVDRARVLNRELFQQTHESENIRAQIEILHRRAKILRLSIVLGVTTVLLAAVLILILFVSALFKIEAGLLLISIFCIGQLALIGSMLAFIRDTNLSLLAIKLELGGRSD
jgi:hypothetical protein